MEVLTTSSNDIRRAAAIVKGGGVIAFPTDTVYGLGCDPHNPGALGKLVFMKGKRKKPFPILVSSPKLAQQIAEMDSRARALASRFWPGPLTIVARSRVRFPELLTKRKKTIAVRCPGSPLALKLIRKCGGLLTGTSANITGGPPCTNAEMVRRLFGETIDAVVDGGHSPRRETSTIVRMHSRGVTILRKGPIRDVQIKRVLSSPVRTITQKL